MDINVALEGQLAGLSNGGVGCEFAVFNQWRISHSVIFPIKAIREDPNADEASLLKDTMLRSKIKEKDTKTQGQCQEGDAEGERLLNTILCYCPFIPTGSGRGCDTESLR
jgi:hypothetical protein